MQLAKADNGKNACGKSAVPLRDWEAFVLEIAPYRVMNKERLQSRFYFEKIGRYDIANAITYHGGMNAINRRLGIEKEKGKPTAVDYHDWKLLEPELRKLQAGNKGVLPTQGVLEEMKKYIEISAIAHHAGFTEVRIALGEKPIRKNGKHSLSNEKVFVDNLLDFSAEHGEDFKKKDMEKTGRSDLQNAVRKLGGLRQAKAAFGMPMAKPPVMELYPDLGKLSPALHEIMKKNGFKVLPSSGWEGWKAHTYEYAAICKLGGFEKVREKIGPSDLQKTCVSFFSDKDEMEKYLMGIISRQKRLPSLEWFADIPQHEEILRAIYTYHGDLWEVRLELERKGATPSIYHHPDCKRPISDLNVLLPILVEIVAENNGILPGRRALRKKYPHVANAIKNNGGIEAIRKLLAEYGIIRPSALGPQVVEPVVL